MWSTEYTAETTLDRKTVWAALRGLHEGTLTYEGADTFELHGPFAVGTELTVTPLGQGSFHSTIIDLVENETYADQTVYGDITLLFRHTLTPSDAGTRVTHRLEIDGASADAVGPQLGPQISNDFGDSMARLFEQAALLADDGATRP